MNKQYLYRQQAAPLHEVHRPSAAFTRATASAGATFGQRVLMGDQRRQERAVSRGCRALVLPGRVVMRAIEIFPAMGISLYQFKTISAVT